MTGHYLPNLVRLTRRPDIRIPAVTFYSQLDEQAFFEWLERIDGVAQVQGYIRELLVGLDPEKVSVATYYDFVHLFERYHLPIDGLRSLHRRRLARVKTRLRTRHPTLPA